ncbi:hypothetical protein [Hominenteromicrobium sp.]|uniref:hypothetical protein n=1 Tax=Hominenteromicrobium sp. TaxID=3073581 RepID=UPI0039965A15
MPFDVLGKGGVKRAARQNGTALGGLYFLASQLMDGFRRQKHDLLALIHCQQESGTGLLPAIHTGIAATADKDGIAPVPTDGPQKGIKFAGCFHVCTSVILHFEK